MGNKNDNIQLFILEQMRKQNTTDQRFKDILQKQQEQPRILLNDQTSQGTLTILKELSAQEKALQIERSKLLQTKEAMQIQISDKAAHGSLSILKELNNQEKVLQNQRSELVQARQEMEIRILEQIEIRKQRIEQHKAEIALLKQNCTYLQTILENH